MVLLGFVRRVAAEGQFSSARKSLRKLSGSALGVTGRSAKETLKGTSWSRDVTPPLRDVEKNTFG